MKIGIGIDTGGTYTDAVVYDFKKKTIVGSAKALTTKDDLSVGILGALDALPKDLFSSVEVVSLSTTLATNACVEGKGGNAKLIFFGGNKSVISELGGKYGLPPVEDIYIQESFTKFSGEIEREPDWALFRDSIESSFTDLDGVGIIEIYAMNNSAVIEKRAKELFLEKRHIPVVCGHELFSDLNCLQRGASTLLNARLFPVIKEFLDAIKIAMSKRNINASVVIVRSDGSLMSEEFASIRPVETLLCGPAASVMGAAGLVSDANSIVVDMGGTTTDIALVKNGIPVKAVDGISIGKWKTFVKGLYINTFGLGGDTAVHYNDYKVFLEDYRVIPLCVAGEKYPQMCDKLNELISTTSKHTKYLHEFYILIKDIANGARYTNAEKSFCEALKNGPLICKEAAAAVGQDIYSLDVSRLLREGIVQMCGLTPTDIMHIKKDFSRYNATASLLGAQYVASNLGISVEELCDSIYDEVKRKLYVNIVKVMLENKNKEYMKNGINPDVERFINESYEIAKTGCKQDFISIMFHTDYTLIGIGAPIRIFLEDVAKMLGTRAAIPKYYEVANALGAIVGKVYATYTIKIKPLINTEGIIEYVVLGGSRNKTFATLEEAEAFADTEARDSCYKEAVRHGAVGEITVSCTVDKQEAQARDCTIYLGTNVAAHAVGSIGF